MQADTEIAISSAGTVPPGRHGASGIWLTTTAALVAIVYSILVFTTAHAHEPWADEAQSWLIARDANVSEIWTKLVRLEGTPGLWHSLLHVLISIGVPYSRLNYISAVLGLASALVLFCASPFPVVIRALLPFTYFLCFQYAVVARNYSLAPVLLFSAAAAYRANRGRPLLMSLVLLALVSAQAFLVSFSFAVMIAFQMGLRWRTSQQPARKTMLVAAAVYVAALLLIALAIWPDGRTVFFITPNWSIDNFIGVSRYAFRQAFGDGYWPLVLIALSLPLLLRRTPGLVLFVVSSLLLCTFGAVVYSNVWHHGFLVLAWLTALWISYNPVRTDWFTLAGLVLFISIQCLWTWNAVRYERSHAYSGSRAMAALLRTRIHPGSKWFGIGFPTVAVQAYFPSNVYANYNGTAFWTWSTESKTNDAAEHLGSAHPELVVLGYSSDADRNLWNHLITNSGYHQIWQSQGSLFWRTGPFQPEDFQLFAPGPQVSDSLLLSDLILSESKADVQLLSGITGPPTPTGRQLAPGSGIALQRPSFIAGQHIARLEMNFVISKEQFGRTGPMNLTVYVSGHRVGRMKITSAGAYSYSSNVTTNELFWAVVPVAFQFQRSGFLAQSLGPDPVATVSRIRLFAQ